MLGSIVLGYLVFYVWNLDVILKTSLIVLSLLSLFIAFRVRKNSYYLSSFSLVLLVFSFLLPSWNRVSHKLGLFRDRTITNQHFKNFFHKIDLLKPSNMEAIFFEDGPQTTVTVTKNKQLYRKDAYDFIKKRAKGFSRTDLSWLKPKKDFISYGIVVNGKSDGNTVHDFSTTYWLAVLPYLLSDPKNYSLQVANVGLGAGVTAGLFGRLSDVNQTTVLEISPKVIEGVKFIKDNFSPLSNKKIKIIEKDAFKFFTRSKKKFDIISSEPSNPWVVGVENLFTKEFYELASKSLTNRGVFSQWLHTYSSDPKMFLTVFQNLLDNFKHVSLYKIGVADYLFLASNHL